MRALKACALALGLVAFPGCFHIKYTTKQPPALVPNFDQWHHNMAFGLAEISDPVNVSKGCPNGFTLVDYQVTAVNVLASFLVYWIWEPSTITVTCSANKADAPKTSSGTPVASVESGPQR